MRLLPRRNLQAVLDAGDLEGPEFPRRVAVCPEHGEHSVSAPCPRCREDFIERRRRTAALAIPADETLRELGARGGRASAKKRAGK